MKLERILKLREEHHLSQDYLANYLNISKLKYYRYECGTISPTPYVLSKLATLYNTSIDYIVGLTNSKEKSL